MHLQRSRDSVRDFVFLKDRISRLRRTGVVGKNVDEAGSDHSARKIHRFNTAKIVAEAKSVRGIDAHVDRLPASVKKGAAAFQDQRQYRFFNRPFDALTRRQNETSGDGERKL